MHLTEKTDLNVLLVTNFKGAWPYAAELMEVLGKNGVTVSVLDIFNLESRTREVAIPLFKTNRIVSFILRIPKIRIIVHRFLVEKALKRFFAGQVYDVCNIHSVSALYADFIQEIGKHAKKRIATVWGSDFYRVNHRIRNRQRKIYDCMDAITFNNPCVKTDFVNYYRCYAERCKIVRFGFKSLDVIREVSGRETVKESRRTINLPEDSLIICCGYNGLLAQQHEKIVGALGNIVKKIPSNALVVVPMTYGSSPEYRERIRHQLHLTGLNYRVLDSFFTIEDVARLRIATDIAVNMQISDSFSASVQEHIFAGNVVIAGSWLPYGCFTENGIRFWQARDFSDLEDVIVSCCGRFDEIRSKCRNNPAAIYDLSSWEKNTQEWIDCYKTL